MTTVLDNTYIEPELKYIETSRFELRKVKEVYHKEQLDIDEKETDKFTSLVESIRDLGILQPIYVVQINPGRYEVVDGGRRLRAAQFLGLHKVPAMVYQGEDAETEIRKRSLIANIHRKDLTPEEKGEGLAAYFASGNVDPVRAVSYLNTLRQRKQIQDQKDAQSEFSRESGKLPHAGGRPSTNVQDGAEYARFLELHKRLGIPRMTQYEWLTKVVFISKEVRQMQQFQELSKSDQKELIREEVRNKPVVQKSLVKDLSAINKDIEKAKATEKKDVIATKVSEFKATKKRKLRAYFPNTTDKKPKRTKDPYAMYGNINGCIHKLWTALTGVKDMPVSVDDVLLDHIKPTREMFQRYVDAIGKNEIKGQYDWLTILEKAMDDRMKILDKATGK